MIGIGQMMKQAREMQTRMAEVQERIAATEATGAAGGGLVEVTMSGKGEVRRVRIDPSLLVADERAVLEDLIAAAHNDARAKVDEIVRQMMADVTGGMGLPPGLDIPGLT